MLCFTIGPPIAAAIMQKDPWLAFTLGLVLQTIAIPISIALPETLGAKRPGEPTKKADDKTESSTFYGKGNLQDRSSKFVQMIKDNAGFLAKDWRVLFLAGTYVCYIYLGNLGSADHLTACSNDDE